MECGEGFDRATLSLLGKQLELLESFEINEKAPDCGFTLRDVH